MFIEADYENVDTVLDENAYKNSNALDQVTEQRRLIDEDESRCLNWWAGKCNDLDKNCLGPCLRSTGIMS